MGLCALRRESLADALGQAIPVTSSDDKLLGVLRLLGTSPELTSGADAALQVLALILERRFTKEQILEIYVNQVDLGQRGSFNIRGFGEAAQAYFGQDIKNLSLPEAALLAGMVNGPSYFSPFRHPERAVKRRNIVLHAMYENHAIDREALTAAEAAPLMT